MSGPYGPPGFPPGGAHFPGAPQPLPGAGARARPRPRVPVINAWHAQRPLRAARGPRAGLQPGFALRDPRGSCRLAGAQALTPAPPPPQGLLLRPESGLHSAARPQVRCRWARGRVPSPRRCTRPTRPGAAVAAADRPAPRHLQRRSRRRQQPRDRGPGGPVLGGACRWGAGTGAPAPAPGRAAAAARAPHRGLTARRARGRRRDGATARALWRAAPWQRAQRHGPALPRRAPLRWEARCPAAGAASAVLSGAVCGGVCTQGLPARKACRHARPAGRRPPRRPLVPSPAQAQQPPGRPSRPAAPCRGPRAPPAPRGRRRPSQQAPGRRRAAA
jgi:hypothetical protein